MDINCTNFPFDHGLFVHRETVGEAYQLDLGGSALNFAKIAAQLELNVSFLGKAGHDGISTVLMTLLEQNNITPSLIFSEEAQTNLAVHYIHPDGTSIMTSCGNANQSLRYEEVMDKLNERFNYVDYLYLGGVFKLKKLLPKLKEIAKKAREKNVNVVLDHGRVNNSITTADLTYLKELLPYVTIYLPSIDEFLSVWESETIENGLSQMQKIANPVTVIKQAENGARGFYEGTNYEAKPYPVQILNTVGAGDSFNAGFLKAQIDGMNFEESLRFACAVAALKISTIESISLEAVKQLQGE